MKKTILFLISALIISTPAAEASSTSEPWTKIQPLEHHGIVKIHKGCSAALVKFTGVPSTSRALVMTNAHCNDNIPGPGEQLINEKYDFDMSLVQEDGGKLKSLTPKRLQFSSMSGTDVAFIELTETYKELYDELGHVGTPYLISKYSVTPNTRINIVSGFWGEVTSCVVKSIVPVIKEHHWQFTDSLKYSSDCVTTGGWSGSPIVDVSNKYVYGVHNTANKPGGEPCTWHNPCELDTEGAVTSDEGARYGQDVTGFRFCLGPNNVVDISQPLCNRNAINSSDAE